MKVNKFLLLLLIILSFILLCCLCQESREGLENSNKDKKDNDSDSGPLSFNNFNKPGEGGSNSSIYYPNEGISKSDIPAGDEDLYIKKSEIVPPVCPICPSADSCPRSKPCPACPACARCPEPSYECKLTPVPSNNPGAFPKPVLTNFSTFGM